MSSKQISLIFHGNCIDGWFSAYIIYRSWIQVTTNIAFYPISPNLAHTWPSLEQVTGTEIIMTDVSVPEETMVAWKSVAASFYCIDHHASSKDLMSSMSCCLHDTGACATYLVWQVMHPGLPIPEWVKQIDRIDRWDNVTEDDRAMREILHQIALMPVKGCVADAICNSQIYILANDLATLGDPIQLNGMRHDGMIALREKEVRLANILERGSSITITKSIADVWQIPESWIDKTGFIIDTTGIILDSTEAGFLAFKQNESAEFFINYRVKDYFNRRTQLLERTYIYSARAREGFDLTSYSLFAGHPCSAGASFKSVGVPAPFVSV